MPKLESQIPGVYLTQMSRSPEAQLLTGVPGFLGVVSSALGQSSAQISLYEPQRLTLPSQFNQLFSSPTEGYLADAVRGFFQNGGRLCYVIPLPDLSLDALKKGLEASELVENIDLICAPDIMRADNPLILQQAVLDHCEQKGDRFAILDAVQVATGSELSQIEFQKGGLKSDYGALYAPWLKIEDRSDFIPPCGHIAGIYARCDQERGVYAAPANQILEGILDLSYSLSPTEQVQLNPETEAGVNIIRSLRGRGLRVWGVRTLSHRAEWQYVNVRRLFLTFKRWIEFNLADTLFEPNEFTLWLRIQRELSVYCESLWQKGALQGTVAQEAFYVNCDARTNPPENRGMGTVVAEIGLAPTIPGEFIELLLVQSGNRIALV